MFSYPKTKHLQPKGVLALSLCWEEMLRVSELLRRLLLPRPLVRAPSLRTLGRRRQPWGPCWEPAPRSSPAKANLAIKRPAALCLMSNLNQLVEGPDARQDSPREGMGLLLWVGGVRPPFDDSKPLGQLSWSCTLNLLCSRSIALAQEGTRRQCAGVLVGSRE